MTKTLFLTILSLLAIQCSKAQLITYKQPDCKMISKDYDVAVRRPGEAWQNPGVYHAEVAAKMGAQHVGKKTSFTYFDCSDSVDVKVKVNGPAVKQVRIRPATFGIVPKVKGNVIEFRLKSTQYVSVEINEDIFENLQVFANNIEKVRPQPRDPNVIYFGPGLHNMGRMSVPSGKTIYIAGGAIVEGGFVLDRVKNVNILGRGILTQYMVQQDSVAIKPDTLSKKLRGDAVIIQYAENIHVGGIIEVPKGYSILMGECKHVQIDDFKSFSSLGNADGIDVFCSDDIKINHIFMRNSDDCIAIYGHRWRYYGNVNNVSVENSTLWADVAHPIVVGTHGDSDHPDTLQNMQFHNLTILDQHENQLDYQGCIALNAGDSNLIKNLRFENIDIADIRKGQLFNLRVMFNRKYNTSPGKGIETVRFKNISYNGTHANMSLIAGYDDQRSIKDIIFENLRINGTFISDDMKGKPSFYKTGDMANIFVGEHTEGIKFITSR